MKTNGIEIEGHSGTFSLIASKTKYGRKIHLLESELYGDAANLLVVDDSLRLIYRNEFNGFLDYEDTLEWVLKKEVGPSEIVNYSDLDFLDLLERYWGVLSLEKLEEKNYA